MTSSNLIEITRHVDNFPALPATVNNVLTVTGDPESSADDLMQAILPDQSMCATILKIANSAFFGIPRKVSTIEQAVVILGFEEIKNIVLGKAVFNSFQHLNHSREAIDLFWEHSFTCGLAAKTIGENIGQSASELFIAGLIHDIGKLAFVMAFPESYNLFNELSEPDHYRNIILEKEQFSTSHDEIGMRILKQWLFPEKLIMATGYHHRPEESPEYRSYPVIIQMADLLSLIYCNPDRLNSSDVTAIFNDFLPEARRLWHDNNLPWSTSELGLWYEQLVEFRTRDQGILDIMKS